MGAETKKFRRQILQVLDDNILGAGFEPARLSSTDLKSVALTTRPTKRYPFWIALVKYSYFTSHFFPVEVD